jgi:small subunit ribosomal protein S16
MLRIRLRRQGSRKQPTYRIVVTDQRAARDGRFVEVIGHYNPRTEPSVAKVDEGRAYYWLGNGAQPSDAVNRIFGWTGTLDRFARMKKGDDIEKLITESIEAAEARPNPTKTRHAAPEKSVSNKKSKSDEKLDDDVMLEEGVEESSDASDDSVQQVDTSSDITQREDVELDSDVIDVAESKESREPEYTNEEGSENEGDSSDSDAGSNDSDEDNRQK